MGDDKAAGAVDAPAAAPVAEELVSHVLTTESVAKAENGHNVFRFVCSCGWVGDVASTDYDIAREPAKMHVESVVLFTKTVVDG